MELRWMRTFVAVARELNFGRAAIGLHISQPAVSQQITQLERSVGTRLIDRSSRRIRLTAAGEAFLPLCAASIASADEAIRAAMNAESPDRGIVRIGFAGSPGAEIFSALARAVRLRYPGIELRIVASLSSAAVMDRLSGGDLDVGFTAEERSVHGVSALLLSAEPLAVAVASDHPLARRSSVRLADLSDEPFVLTSAAAGLRVRDVAIEACIDVGFRPRVAQEADDAQTVLALVSAGIGVTITAGALLGSAAPVVQLLRITDVSRTLRTIVAWRSEHMFGALRSVLSVIEEHWRTPSD